MAQETPAQEANIAPVNEKVGESNVTTGDDTTVEKPTNGFVGEENGLGQEKRDRIGRLGALPIEELVYHANLQRRAYGVGSATSEPKKLWWFKFFENQFGPDVPSNPLIDHNVPGPEEMTVENDAGVTLLGRYPQDEWSQDKDAARKSLRTASWGMMFFIITTDVIGPTNAPYAFSTLGFVGGVLLYLVFGVAAYYSSFVILNLYLRLDSTRHPIHTYGELMEVFFGKIGHYSITIMQVVQILFIVGSNNIANAQSMTQLTSQRSAGPLCFIVSIVIWTVVGFINSVPFRSLRKLSYIASLNVFINIFVCFLTMGFVTHSAPNYDSAAATYGYKPPYEPIKTTAVAPSGDLANSVNGAMNMVFGWSGLMIFVEFLNEMRHPWHFWKSFTLAEAIVLTLYLLFGAYVYALQGQYTLPVAYQGVSSYVWQSVGNGLSLWTYTMASVTYLNIAVKIVYWLLFQQVFRGPALMSNAGFFYWTGLQAVAWAISFVIGTAIPQVQTIQALVAAAILLQFSYTLPPVMQFAFDIQADASRHDGVFSPQTGPQRIDTWRMWTRWKRGLFGGGVKRVIWKWLHVLMFTAALATSGLGIWGSVETIKATFKSSQATSFGCTAPV